MNALYRHQASHISPDQSNSAAIEQRGNLLTVARNSNTHLRRLGILHDLLHPIYRFGHTCVTWLVLNSEAPILEFRIPCKPDRYHERVSLQTR